MEKMVWEKPEMNDIAFGASEYVAACGDSGANYFFTCDAGSKQSNGYYVYVDVTNDGPTDDDLGWLTYWNWNGDMYEGRETKKTGATYKPCGSTHEASTDDDFLNGYMYEANRWETGHKNETWIDVIIWGEEDNSNTHCTTNLDISTWKVNWSA